MCLKNHHSDLKILIFDIETAPGLGDIWHCWKANIGVKQLRDRGFIMSWAAKFLDEDYVYYDSCRSFGKAEEKRILETFKEVIEKADVVVAHNGDNFDMKWIRAQMLYHNMEPVPPIKQVDTLKIAKQQFRFMHNRLEYLANFLGCTPKDQHKEFPGHELWSECLAGNQKAWDEMIKYNIQDVITLEEIYLKLRPWTKGGALAPNLGINDEGHVCPKCGSHHVQRRGFAYTNVSKFQRYKCNDCGGWSRGRTNVVNKERRKTLLTNVT